MTSSGDEGSRLRLEADCLRAHGGALALTGAGPDLSYRTLAGRAEAVADALEDCGVKAGERVAVISTGRAHDEPVALAGILAHGAVVVPLDPSSPPARLEAIVEQSGCRALVHDAAMLGKWRPERLARVELDEEGFVLSSAPTTRAATIEPDSRLAAVLHTSGSTGSPKAVPITWSGLDAFTQWMTSLSELSPGVRVLRVAELVFDLAWFDHLATFRAGATLATMTRRELATAKALTAAAGRLAPQVIYGVPSMFVKLTSVPKSVNTICYAGEVFPPAELARLWERAHGAGIFNMFGPTETNVCCFHQLRTDDLGAETPIGQPTPYAHCRLESEGRTIEGAGVGELVVRGPTALGGEHATGDRVERKDDGLLYFRGRIDRMVKIRGYRVEPGEVEAGLLAHPWVRETAVVAGEDPRLGRTLVAHVSLRAGDATLAPRALRKYLREQLAPYMVPETVRVHDALPRTTTGKIDYKTLD